ncbi:uncharacterized protein LOC119613139 [Lucilia sericata]|uniref:uncharacterized protein LOC119613139 n=1 Tax=Lucilia sericata TaxID=13632 RepID=UPI0018A8029F|nr:uncharacterized protein LOC119613139 [Lucilia sericata]
MKCSCNRYTLGIILGGINVAISSVILILQCIYLNDYKEIEDPDLQKKSRNKAIIILILCLITVVIAGLFIYGIVKRKYKLAYPWLIFCAASVFATLKQVVYAIIDSAKGRISGEETAARITIFLLITVFESVIYWFSLSVYRKLRNEEKSADIPMAYQTDYTSVPNSV